MKKTKPSVTMLILMLVMLINGLSYGTIIPLLYPYSSRFGIGPGELSLLMASYSFFQFLATPIIGRLSDRYGRKPLLVVCLLGTAGSLALFASATSLLMLFIARIIDGITGGNNSAAQAVVADTYAPAQRTKAFGMLGAASGFGFLLGPAFGGLLSQSSLSTPFWIASGIALVSSLVAAVFLPETHHQRKPLIWRQMPLFDFGKLWQALWAPTTGIILLITLLVSTGTNSFILGFQSVTADILKLSPFQVGLLFTAFGLVNVFMLSIGIRLLLKLATSVDLLRISLVLSIVLVGLLGFATSPWFFTLISLGLMFAPPVFPFLSSLLSSATKPDEQGGMLGINQAYTSIGQVIGPLAAGLVAQWYVPGAFWITAGLWGVGLILTQRLPRVSKLEKV